MLRAPMQLSPASVSSHPKSSHPHDEMSWGGGARRPLLSTIPASKRKTSSIEYVANAAKLFSYTLDCAQKLPKRWTFLLTERVVNCSAKVLEHAKAANSVYVTCAMDAELRRFHLLQAYCFAQALSSYVDEMFQRFPSRTDNGKPCISQASYLKWVESIDKEFDLLKGVMQSDKKRFDKFFAQEKDSRSADIQMSLFEAVNF